MGYHDILTENFFLLKKIINMLEVKELDIWLI